MEKEFLKSLVVAAAAKEISRQNLDLDALAENHAVMMLDEIKNILNTRLSSDEKIERILKILVFCEVPPHI